jgi:hypothetical protein
MKYFYLVAATVLVFLLALPPYCHAAGGVIVIGDSMSAQPTSWPTWLRENTGRNVMVMAQNGRTIRDFTIPSDLQKDWNMDTVIFLLGGNDIFNKTPDGLLKQRIVTHLRFLKDRGFRVIVVLLPPWYGKEKEVHEVNMRLAFIAWSMDIEVISIDAVWDTGGTYDTVHPLEPLSRSIAEEIGKSL